jgi:glycine cleavage system H protein
MNYKIYYTPGHEWISFLGTVACVGVCKFKLSGFKQIHELMINDEPGPRKQGDPIVTICYNDYRIEVGMPVSGKIAGINPLLLKKDYDAILHDPEKTGWIARIIPDHPYERKDLLTPDKYGYTVTRQA